MGDRRVPTGYTESRGGYGPRTPRAMNEPRENALVPFDIELRGSRIRYVEGGPRDAPAVVFLHGLGRDHEQFIPLASALIASRRVVAVDLPGFGASAELTGARAWEPIAETVIDLVACLELGRVTLVGHSLGGAIAIVAAADRPEFVERLVLVTPACYRNPLAVDERLLQMPLLGRTMFRRAIGTTVLRRHVGHDARSSAQTWGWLAELSAPSTIEARVPRVRAPALIVWGREDRVAPWTHGTRLARELGRARLEILDCGHFPEAERPAAVGALVSEFVGVTQRREGRAPAVR